MLVHQLREDTSPDLDNLQKLITLDDSDLSTTVKHCNSFNSENLEDSLIESNTETALSKFERRLSTNTEILGNANDIFCFYYKQRFDVFYNFRYKIIVGG